MGSGASTGNAEAIKKQIEAEKAKPLGCEDVDTPRGVSAKEEVKRLRTLIHEYACDNAVMAKALMGDVPSLMEFFEHTFAKWDKDDNGTLSKEEFWGMLQGLKLNLTDVEIAKLQTLADEDGSSTISLEEFAKNAPHFFSKLVEGEEPSADRDWIQLETEDGHAYYYNKRTQEAVWEAPTEFLANVDASAAEKEASMPPDMIEYLTTLFRSADADGSGELELDEFWSLLSEKLNLGLTGEKMEQLRAKSDVDSDGKVRWQEFVLVAEGLIRSIHDAAEESDCWYMQRDDSGTPYYINSKTGATQWEAPDGVTVNDSTDAGNGDESAPPAVNGDGSAPPAADGEEAS